MQNIRLLVVILGTPVLTKWLANFRDVNRLLVGQILVVIGLSAYMFVQDVLPVYFISMILEFP